ncbi:hypothetical protein Tco_1274330 [Tanacetum coccineum]
MNYDAFVNQFIHSEDVFDRDLFTSNNLEREFFDSINTTHSHALNESVSSEFMDPCNVNWFVNSLTHMSSGLLLVDTRGELNMTLSLQKGLMVRNEAMVLSFWPSIRDVRQGWKVDLCWYLCDRLATSFGILTRPVIGALSVEPPTKIIKKESLVAIYILLEFVLGKFHWVRTREVQQ